MGKYIVKEINAIGYERFLHIVSVDTNIELKVCFFDFGSSVIDLPVQGIGDIIDVDFSVELVRFHQKIDNDLTYKQVFPDSSYIEAVVQICEILDDSSLYAYSSINDEKLLIDFETEISNDYNVGDNILISGELRIFEFKNKILTK